MKGKDLAGIFQIGKQLVSMDVIQEHFVCDLAACKGACCVHGDSGAPLEHEEAGLLEKELPLILPFLREEGRKTIRELGPHVIDSDRDTVTPLVEGNECAYVVFDKGVARCGIETAYHAGKVSLRKPVSCHLYPVRIKGLTGFDGLNVDRWEICKPARLLGSQLQIPVYVFVKDALIRNYGHRWYRKLEKIAGDWKKQREKEI